MTTDPSSSPADHPSRREFLRDAALSGVALALAGVAADASLVAAAAEPASPAEGQKAGPVLLRWLGDTAPLTPSGVTWGVPWARGAVPGAQPFQVQLAGRAVPSQSWPLAYWPDGSLKWSGVALAADPSMTGALSLVPGAPVSPAAPLTVHEAGDAVTVSTGALVCIVPRSGADLIASLAVDGREVGRRGRLIALREDRTQEAKGWLRQETYASKIGKVTVEQAGPIRAVVRIDGVHASADPAREWLPFTVRLYFFAGLASVRMVHSFVFDGDAQKDFIRGLGVAFTVPFREERQNRHVRFVADGDGVWGEPVLMSPGYRDVLVAGARAMNADQLLGKRIPNLDALGKGRAAFESVALWDGFKLAQLGPDSFSLQKRTGTPSSYLQVFSGNRARGCAFLGDVSGGLAVGVKHFWEKYPAALEINGAAADAGELKVWFWSPEAPAMDLRHYDTIGHDGGISYEDYTEGFSTPTGVANTNELTLWALTETPANAALLTLARTANEPPLLVCAPEHYHATQTLGIWSLEDRSTPDGLAAEKQMDRMWDFYRGEADRRRWYGFWDFGDVMRTYDSLRHTWMYDIGGHAWNNTELMPNAWLWFAFLRSGRADIFRFAEAMTRNTSEVDVYHSGPFVGLGSRHNVNHWGCGAKESRISEAFLKRFYYYLTADERTGDLMREVLEVDHTVDRIQPLRKQVTRGDTPIIRAGPDWLAFASNWMTEWERTGNPKYRDYLLTGMKCIGAMPEKFVKLQAFRYDSKTKELFDIGEPNNKASEFLDLFGGDQIAADLMALLPNPEFAGAWDLLCRNWATNPKWRGYTRMRVVAYTAWRQHDAALRDEARQLFAASLSEGGPDKFLKAPVPIVGPLVPEPVEEIAGVNTPGVAQWAINLITTGEYLRRFDAGPQPAA